MSQGYNFYNLEAPFKTFLNSGNKQISPISVNNYLSDLRHFFGWLAYTIKSSSSPVNFDREDYAQILNQFLSENLIQQYVDYLLNNNIPVKTINRRLSTVRKFCAFCLSQGWIKTDLSRQILNVRDKEAEVEINLEEKYKASESPIIESPKKPIFVLEGTSMDQPRNLRIRPYLTAILILALVFIFSAWIFNQFFKKSTKKSLASRAFPSTPELGQSSPRYITFQSKVKDKLGNPIIDTADFQFKLYSSEKGGTALYTSGVCSLTPDVNGVLTVLVGGAGVSINKNSCGAGIEEKIFSDSPNIYLGITIGSDSEAVPRQQIANVGYAANTQTLQGLPLGTGASAIPYLNSDGDILIANSHPSIKSISENVNFTLASANNLILQAGAAVGGPGDIILQATGGGALRFRTGGDNDGRNRLYISDVGNIAIGNTTASQLLTLGSFEQLKISSTGALTTSGEVSASQLKATSELNLESGKLNLTGTSGNIALTNFGTTSITSIEKKGSVNSLIDSVFAVGDADTGNLLNLGFTNNSTNTTGISTTTGLNITVGNNASAIGGTMDTYGIRIQNISGTAHDGNQRNYGIKIGNQGLASTETSYGLFVDSQSGSATSYGAVFVGGNVGIGTDAPGRSLDVAGTIRTAFTQTATTNGVCHSGSDVSSAQSGTTDRRDIVACSAAPGDIAEWYDTTGTEPGDIVATSDQTLTYQTPVVNAKTGEVLDQKETLIASVLEKTSRQSQANTIGVISTSPYETFGKSILDKANLPNPVALTGRVPVKVSTEGGPLKIGDFITSSSISGTGMKPSQAGIVVAKALEEFDPQNGKGRVQPCPSASQPGIVCGKVNASINLTWFDPKQDIDSLNLQIASLSDDAILGYALEDKLGNFIDKVGAFSELTAANIGAGLITTRELIAEKISTTDLFTKNISVEEKIISPVIETTDIKASGEGQINKISTNVIKPQEKDLTVILNDSEGSDLKSDSSTPSQNDNSQSGPLARIIIKGLDGKIVSTIDASGNATFSGTLAAKEATISGTVVANRVESKEASISGKLSAREIESQTISDLRDRLTNAANDNTQNSLNSQTNQNSINEIQALLADIRSQPLPDPNYYQDINSNVPIDSDSFEQLTVTGTANLYAASVINSLTAGRIAIDQDQILSLTSELKLSALSTISLLDGAVVIARDGTMTTKGVIIAQGGIEVQNSDLRFKNSEGQETAKIDRTGAAQLNSLTTKSLNISDKYFEATNSAAIVSNQENYQTNGIFAPAIETERQTAGVGIIPANSSEVLIYNDSVESDSLIYLTPTTQTTAQLTVVNKEPCPHTNIIGVGTCRPYFKVSTSQPTHPNIGFNWLIIN